MNTNLIKYSFLVCVLVINNLICAWGDRGHMLVAQIAYEFMSEPARCQADKLIKLVARDFPDSDTFVTAACWPDDLKGFGITYFNSWHNINIPYAPDFTIKPVRLKFINLELKTKFNIERALTAAYTTLANPQASSWVKR